MMCVAGLTSSLLSAGQVSPPVPAAPSAPAPAAPAAPANGMIPMQRADATPRGQLKNPYSDGDAAVVESGHQSYPKYACSGCHRGNGGGGVWPPPPQRGLGLGGGGGNPFRPGALRAPRRAGHGVGPAG